LSGWLGRAWGVPRQESGKTYQQVVDKIWFCRAAFVPLQPVFAGGRTRERAFGGRKVLNHRVL